MDTIFVIMLALRKKYKSGNALEILQEAILSGDLPEGLTVTQSELAESLGISRMPVREALISLEYQGLTERLPGQHVRITTLNDEYIRSIFTDMGIIEAEAVKELSAEKLMSLSICERQTDFHRTLRRYVAAPLRRKFLEAITEIYLPFVLRHCRNAERIDAVFGDLLPALKYPLDMGMIRSCYAVYSEVLSGGLIRIRRRCTYVKS